MGRSFQLAILTSIFGLCAGSPTLADIQADKDEIFDCGNPASKFETIVCANPSVFDMINHNHQRFKYAPSPEAKATIALRNEYYVFIGDLEKLCPPENARAAASCLQEAVQGPAMLSFDKRIDQLYDGVSDEEGIEECDGCEDNEVHGTSNSSKSSFLVNDPNDQSPMDFVRRLQNSLATTTQDEVARFYKEFWSTASTRIKAKKTPNDEVDDGWDVAEKSEPLTGSTTKFAKKVFEFEGASIEIALSCDASKRQMLFSATDRTDVIDQLNIPNTAVHFGETNTRFIPSPSGFPDNHIFNGRTETFGRTFTLIGFNPLNWGIGFCQSGMRLAPNSPFCQLKTASLPDHISQSARQRNAAVNDNAFKKRDFVPARWSDFEEIRYSLRTVWNNPAAGQTVPQQYFFTLYPNKQPLRSLFDMCERDEDRCVSIADEKEAKACRTALLKEMTNG